MSGRRWSYASKTFLFLTLVFSFFLINDADARRCGTSAPPAAPQRRTGGESFPPLPLPATPLRRSEKKREPSPPALMGKLEYGKIVWDVDENGQRYSYRDWTTDPVDMSNLLVLAGRELGINYRGVHIQYENFSFDPQEVPVLYLTGHERLEYPAELREKLRWYLNDGGFIIADACCGAKEFTEGFVDMMKDLYPDRPMHVLPADHPIYRSYFKIDEVGYHSEGKPDWRTSIADTPRRPPYLLGLNIGCRTAVIMTPFDLSCGWDGHPDPGGEGVVYDDAQKMGINILAYSLASYRLGRYFSWQEQYFQEEEPSRDRLVFGQVIHDGDWDPTPKGIIHLLKYISSNTTVDVQFKREPVQLDRAEALHYPFLYMTGHLDFTLSEGEIQGLRNYLRAGGILFADSCCGRREFDIAFRREIKRVLPEFEIQQIPAAHPVFSSAVEIGKVSYSGQLSALEPELDRPRIDGIFIGGRLAVIYSRYGIGTHWDGMPRPYSLAYEPDDALKLGVNIILYSLTH